MALSDTPILLDYTLRDLYLLDNDRSCDNFIVVYTLPSMQSKKSSSTKFCYQISLAQNDVENKMALRQQTIVQRTLFLTGSLSLFLLDNANANTSFGTASCTHHINALANLRQLNPDQVPNLSFVKSVAEINFGPEVQIIVILPDDQLLGLPHVVDPEVHYEISSKRWLALSNLPIPETTVIDITPVLLSIHSRSDLVNAEIDSILMKLQKYQPPFVVKLSLSTAGQGTFMVLADLDKRVVTEKLRPILQEMLKETNQLNQHLYSSSLVFQEMISGEAMSISIFVTKKGNVVPVVYSSQMFDEAGYWQGGVVFYDQQDALKQFYAETVNTFARELFEKGYYGPAGVDVMIDQTGRQVIIDVNPRVTGSYHLGLLKCHFTSRGLFAAVALNFLHFSCTTRSAFEESSPFASKLKDGSLIIIAWFHDSNDGSSMASIAIGGKDKCDLEMLIEQMNQYRITH